MKDAKDCIAKIPYKNYTYICDNNVDNEKWFNVSFFFKAMDHMDYMI